MCDVVQDESQRRGLPARDRVFDGCDVEDVDRRIRRLGQAGIGREHRCEQGEVAEERRGEDVLVGTRRQEQRLDHGTMLHPDRAERRHEDHPLERHPGDADRKVERMVRPDAAVQQHPDDSGAACQGGGLHDRRRIRRKQQIRRLRQRRGEPACITTVSQILRPRHATGADAAPGHWPWAVPCLAPADAPAAGPVRSPGGSCRGHLRADQSHGEGADLREDRPAIGLGRDRGLHRPAEVPQPPAGERGRDRQTVVAVSHPRVGVLAETTRTAQPLGEEQLLHRPAAGEVAPEQRAQLIVVPDLLIQQVNQSVDRRLAADALEQIGTTEGPETRRVIQQAAVLKAGQAGTGRRLPAQGGRVLLACAGSRRLPDSG